jgi:UDP-N-acetylglucosamine--N-acetylmuramyl-(pentapeptide) pyrophosphoryl-undecaprenol N-acetylglucosamine transferase
LYVQYPHLVGGRWRYLGSVFDKFRSVAADDAPRVKRVVVTLGSSARPFRRLVKRLLTVIPPDVDVFWQTGGTPVSDLPIRARPMVTADILVREICQADAVVAHAGCGSALTALNAGKYPLLVPREPKNDELVDGHQVEIARFLNERDLALHRAPEAVSFRDVVAVAGRRVQRLIQPPTIRLAG